MLPSRPNLFFPALRSTSPYGTFLADNYLLCIHKYGVKYCMYIPVGCGVLRSATSAPNLTSSNSNALQHKRNVEGTIRGGALENGLWISEVPATNL